MKIDLDKKTVTCEFTFDERNAFMNMVEWQLWEQDVEIPEHLESFIDKVFGFDDIVDKLPKDLV